MERRQALNGRPLRILVADDDRDSVLTLTMLLQDHGYEVHGVHNGTEAMAGARRLAPDVALLDIGMPDLTGYELAEAMRHRFGREIFLIAITALTAGADKLVAQFAGFDYHLAKPYDPDVLMALIEARKRVSAGAASPGSMAGAGSRQ